MFQALPVPNSQLFVWVFVPYRITEQGLLSEYYEFPETREELADAFAELGVAWKWQPITFENMHTVVMEVVASSNEHIPVVLNYCDGTEIDGEPGISVIKLLEAKGIIFTGADTQFFHLSNSKISMKSAFVEAGVPTAPYEVIADISRVQGVCHRLGTPLIVKPAISYSSRGISLQSVVESDELLSLQIQRLLAGQHGREFSPDSIFVERFINGPEFTVFLVGSTHQPESIKVYPPVELIFHSDLPETERFLSFERYWEKYEEETPVSQQEPFLSYQLVSSALHDKLCHLGKRAYCGVGGNGYGRVDIRMDKACQEFFVLEVNPNPWLTAAPNDTPVGSILHLTGISFAQLMSEIISEAFVRHSLQFAA